ncbi:unnamed protein product [Miscanthus lutarioriparius]|uniref:Uncharacterized protein n=1 Tax=Miscanthus lutarioriparius TaxID=422564 RepID=A0A811R714_9POAL|nr:unnamed protein product [Miscanthus lutarioriparius]
MAQLTIDNLRRTEEDGSDTSSLSLLSPVPSVQQHHSTSARHLPSQCPAGELKFGANSYREALGQLLELEQTSSLQYQICMHNSAYDGHFFVSHFIKGLKLEIGAAIKSQVPDKVDTAYWPRFSNKFERVAGSNYHGLLTLLN